MDQQSEEDAKREYLALMLQAMLELAVVGQTIIAGNWLQAWSMDNLDATKPKDMAIFGAPFHLITHSIEILKAIRKSLEYGLETPGLGLVGPGYSLLRSQMECYWNILLLLRDKPLLSRHSLIYTYCYNMALYNANKANIEGTSEQEMPSQVRQAKMQALEQARAAVLDARYYDFTKIQYDNREHPKPEESGKQSKKVRKGKANPEWYEVYEYKGRPLNTIYDLAVEVDQRAAYKKYYAYWSAVAHATAPPIGVPMNMTAPDGWLELKPDLDAMLEVAHHAINQACDTYMAFVKGLMGDEYWVILRSNYIERISQRIPGTKINCLQSS